MEVAEGALAVVTIPEPELTPEPPPADNPAPPSNTNPPSREGNELSLSEVRALLGEGLESLPPGPTSKELHYDLRYDVRLLPKEGIAKVAIDLDQDEPIVRSLRLRIDKERHFDFKADGAIEQAGPLFWLVPKKGGRLEYSVRVDQQHGAAGYRSRLDKDWAIFRAEHLIPPIASQALPGSEADAVLRIKTPKGWQLATPYRELKPGFFSVEQSHRQLDQPRGWWIAGDIQVARTKLAGTEVIVGVPKRFDFHPASVLALLRPTAEPLRELVGELPPRILIVAAGDPMWRGGLSGPGSLYLHTARPLIQRDGTSPLIHELMHVVSHAHSGVDGDWIVEGLAEYYSINLLERSGLIDAKQRDIVLRALRKRGESVDPARLLPGESSGARTARAVAILADLDKEIRARSADETSLDDVVRWLAQERTQITIESFIAATREATGQQVDSYFRERIRESEASDVAAN